MGRHGYGYGEIEYENDDDLYGAPPWYAEKIVEEQKQNSGQNSYMILVEVGIKKNADGQFIDRHGLTKEEYQDRQDELRWSRVREWARTNLLKPKET